MSELKPCHCSCGGEAKITICPIADTVYIECESCGLMLGRPYQDPGSKTHYLRSERNRLIRDWNALHGHPAIPYKRLLKLARKMHLWIFNHACDETAAYEEIGLTDEENTILGYGGQFEIGGDGNAQDPAQT